MIETIDEIRKKATKELNQKRRSELGQFMTPDVVAKFMASLFHNDEHEQISLLDAGAGIGSLTMAFLANKLTASGTIKNINITAYEIERTLINYLKANLDNYRDSFLNVGINLQYKVIDSDFIRNAVTDLVAGKDKVITHAILNPPYKKINSSSDHRKLARLLKFETVNLYSAFVGIALHLLKDQGQLVAIIPRSFCNGNYYKGFRDLITKYSAISRIHLFDSRDQAFKDDEVLQENIIIHLVKGGTQESVIVSRSTDQSLTDLEENVYPYSQIVKPNDTEAFIRIPHADTNHLDESALINFSLDDLELTVSTGPVVDFRSKDQIFQDPQAGTVPLLYPVHFNGRDVDWPQPGKKPNAIAYNTDTSKMLYPAGYYPVVRRFSSKEEKKRITARVINPKKLNSSYIGIENHLNVFHWQKKGIPEDLAYGLAAYLNSSVVDIHFRSFNGHTQVNATDLRQMKYPAKSVLLKLGKWARNQEDFNQEEIDKKIQGIL